MNSTSDASDSGAILNEIIRDNIVLHCNGSGIITRLIIVGGNTYTACLVCLVVQRIKFSKDPIPNSIPTYTVFKDFVTL